MYVWRDQLHGMPNVVISGIDPVVEDEGVLEDPLVFVLDPTKKEVVVYDQDGERWVVTLPDEALEGEYIQAGLVVKIRRGGL